MARKTEIEYIRYYTVDSAARQIAPVLPLQEPKTPVRKKVKCRRFYVDPVAIFGIAVAMCMLCAMAIGLVQLKQMEHRTQVLEQYVDQLHQENVQLSTEFDDNCNIAEIEQTALALGMVPAEDAPQMPLTVILPQTPDKEVEPVSLWEQLTTFLSGLFA